MCGGKASKPQLLGVLCMLGAGCNFNEFLGYAYLSSISIASPSRVCQAIHKKCPLKNRQNSALTRLFLDKVLLLNKLISYGD